MPTICTSCGRILGRPATALCPDDDSPLSRLDLAPTSAELSGRVLGGRYRIFDRLGGGGMGVVYRGEQTTLGREVAVKIISGDVTEARALRFMQEARLAAQLTTPHAVVVHDFGVTADGILYLVMERLRGETLRDALRAAGRLPSARALDIVAQIALGLAAAHERGLFHRDLKPSNVFLQHQASGPDLVKLLDFGVARAHSDDDVEVAHGRRRLAGTPPWMSPEQIRREVLDGRSDVYALGVVFYQLVTGRLPFRGSADEVMRQHLHHPFPLPEQLSPPVAVPRPAADLLVQMLQKDRDRRTPSARAVWEAAAELTTGHAEAPRPTGATASVEGSEASVTTLHTLTGGGSS